MSFRKFTLTLTCVAGIALGAGHLPAASLGEAVTRSLDASAFSQIGGVPPERLEAIHAVSDMFAARRAGIATGKDADVLLAGRILELAASLPDLAGAGESGLAVAIVVEGTVITEELRAVLTAEELSDDHPLVLASLAFTLGMEELANQRLLSDGIPPTNPCFEQFRQCMNYCAGLPTAFDRSICGLDCALQLVGCVRSVIYPPRTDPRAPELVHVPPSR